MIPYIRDILSQPNMLRAAPDHCSKSALEKINLMDFDHVILSGMDSSFNATYPALIELSKQLVPVQLVNAAELSHSLSGMIGTRSLLWLNLVISTMDFYPTCCYISIRVPHASMMSMIVRQLLRLDIMFFYIELVHSKKMTATHWFDILIFVKSCGIRAMTHNPKIVSSTPNTAKKGRILLVELMKRKTTFCKTTKVFLCGHYEL